MNNNLKQNNMDVKQIANCLLDYSKGKISNRRMGKLIDAINDLGFVRKYHSLKGLYNEDPVETVDFDWEDSNGNRILFDMILEGLAFDIMTGKIR